MKPVFALLLALLTSVALGSGCGPATPPPEAAQPIEIEPGEPLAVAEGSPAESAVAFPEAGAIPVTADDPVWGDVMAPVTIVEFADFQCPFCQRASLTLQRLREVYGPSRLRIAFKHNPLPFHKEARPAADFSMAVFRLGGPEAFWSFYHAAFGERLDERRLGELMTGTGYREQEIADVMPGARQKVDDDIALAAKLGATGTPAFFINGEKLSGAQPAEKFQAIIDRELRQAQLDTEAGVSADRMYAHRTAQNLAAVPAPSAPKPPPPAVVDTTVHFVPVGASPVRGKATAPVTLVMFSEFQCPFCARALPTVEALASQYGDDLRVVFKHNPLPFHKRAEPAAQLAIEAHKKLGNPGFWKAYEALFAQQKNLEDGDLASLARTLGLNPTTTMAAVNAQKHKAIIEADQGLAGDLDAKGTPTFFINGRRLVGAQPKEKFEALIDEELAKARALIRAGTPADKVYDAIMKSAAQPPPPKTVNVPAPTKDNPSRGPKNAPVVVQVFGDFQCPFCARALPTLEDLQTEFPNEVRVVFRHLPLPMHRDAPLASAASIEAFRQKGDAGFWKMHDLLFGNQKDLSRAALEAHASTMGLDLAKFSRALDAGTHEAAVEADMSIARSAQISGTPAFAVNSYFISGAQPLSAFRKLVRRALDDARAGKKPAAVATP